ncbi:hypothetical protein [Nocardia sp. NPDC004604]|uniref:hypothetical protein n=1 Tax=Nocardia sp. NPDC004604 TaxID=3157013 RepID=UPI0033A54AE4
MRYRPVESDSEDTSRRDMAAERCPLSAAQRGIRFPEQVAGSAPMAVARYIEIVGDLHLDVPAQFGLWAGRAFGTGYLRVIDTAMLCERCSSGIVTAIDDGHPGRVSGSFVAPELGGSAEGDSGGAGRCWRPHVRDRICGHVLGIARDAMTAAEVLSGTALVVEQRGKLDRPRVCATC